MGKGRSGTGPIRWIKKTDVRWLTIYDGLTIKQSALRARQGLTIELESIRPFLSYPFYHCLEFTLLISDMLQPYVHSKPSYFNTCPPSYAGDSLAI
ncbi:unnamed protein product [Nezara viridula]|uniref:Uncharacterized protein n=1 Tax=Nezara viridula TaxID=85310 RepID=A0A9P0E846_NEZVI|nr:unnamed protein product [Nezara viridula]